MKRIGCGRKSWPPPVIFLLSPAFEDNLFSWRPTPGNIVLLRNSRPRPHRFRHGRQFEPRCDQRYRQAVAVANREYAKAAELYLMMSDSLPIMDVAAFRTEMVALYRNWEARSRLRDLSYYEKSISGGAANDVQTIARKYKVNPSWQFLRVGRAISTLDANLNALLGNADPTKLIRRYNQGPAVAACVICSKTASQVLSTPPPI
ncbi:MAG: hypothetical protein IPL78_30185 [Chloroflexi bacterium]|nr:hypothetical protein [Chloroflexota bacterium]